MPFQSDAVISSEKDSSLGELSPILLFLSHWPILHPLEHYPQQSTDLGCNVSSATASKQHVTPNSWAYRHYWASQLSSFVQNMPPTIMQTHEIQYSWVPDHSATSRACPESDHLDLCTMIRNRSEDSYVWRQNAYNRDWYFYCLPTGFIHFHLVLLLSDRNPFFGAAWHDGFFPYLVNSTDESVMLTPHSILDTPFAPTMI